MKIITYINDLSDWELLKTQNVDELIVSCREISPGSMLSASDLAHLLTLAELQTKTKLFLEWDDLPTENKLMHQLDLVQSLPLEKFSGVRARDLGVAHLLLKSARVNALHLILESGSRNLASCQGHLRFFGSKLKRLVITSEVPADTLAKWRTSMEENVHAGPQFDVEFEVLAFGKILLFTTPRPLLDMQVTKDESMEKAQFLQAYGESEESPHRGFFFHQGQLGMLMFLPKELSLLPHLEELRKIGIAAIRIDLRFENRMSFFPTLFSLIRNFDLKKYSDFKATYPVNLIAGFFHANQTDRQFKKLKNVLLNRKGPDYFGEVKEVKKDAYIVIQVGPNDRSLEAFQKFHFVTPEGSEGDWQVEQWHDAFGELKMSAVAGDVLIAPFRSKIAVRTQLFV